MVVLRPIEGERVKTCPCGTTGLCSPVLERTTFYRLGRSGRYRSECRRCANRRRTERQRTSPAVAASARRRRRRYVARNPEAHRASQRAYRDRMIEEDPTFRARQNAAQRRYQARIRSDPTRVEERRDNARMAHRGRREREGHVMTVAETPKNLTSGIRLPIGPFRAWIEELIEEAKREARLEGLPAGKEDAKKRVGARLGVAPRRVHAYLKEMKDVDEAIADRLVCRDGRRSLWDLYPEQLGYEPAQLEMVA